MRVRHRQRIHTALALVTVMLVTASPGRASEALSRVPGQAAAAAYLQQWGQLLWGLVTVQTGAVPVPVGEPVVTPDGSLTIDLAAPDGTRATLTNAMDGSVRLVAHLPDGTTQVFGNSPLTQEGSLFVMDSTLTSTDGLSVAYRTAFDLHGTPGDPGDDVTEIRGSAVLPEGTAQTFRAVTAAGRTELRAVQSDGSEFVLSTPVAAPFFDRPDFGRPATGTYTGRSSQISFTLTATPADPSRWGAFLCNLGDGVTGTFGLNADFSGFGQVEQEGALAALVSWTRDGDVEAYALDGSNLHMTPSGASLDFLLHRWETLTAFMGPVEAASRRVAPRVRGPRGPAGKRRGGVAPPPRPGRRR